MEDLICRRQTLLKMLSPPLKAARGESPGRHNGFESDAD